MRGQAIHDFPCCCDHRITPADAGTRYSSLHSPQAARDHPRGCGDKLQALPCPALEVGSPPRMRGQVSRAAARWAASRITPADAGTRFLRARSCVYPEDHPRGCGDKLPDWYSDTGSQGSPPRMRGQVFQHRPGFRYSGITPADAGTRLLALI